MFCSGRRNEDELIRLYCNILSSLSGIIYSLYLAASLAGEVGMVGSAEDLGEKHDGPS